MGAWDELDTEITIDVDTSDLEEILTLDGEVFEPVIDTVKTLIKNIHDGSKEAVENISKRNKSFQQEIIGNICKNPTGMLQSSIHNKQINGGYGYLVGTVINHIYPMSVNYGADIYPKNKKVLRFQPPPDWKGKVSKDGFVFLKEAHQKPKPFVAPAYRRTDRIAEQIVLRKIEIAKKRI